LTFRERKKKREKTMPEGGGGSAQPTIFAGGKSREIGERKRSGKGVKKKKNKNKKEFRGEEIVPDSPKVRSQEKKPIGEEVERSEKRKGWGQRGGSNFF